MQLESNVLIFLTHTFKNLYKANDLEQLSHTIIISSIALELLHADNFTITTVIKKIIDVNFFQKVL